MKLTLAIFTVLMLIGSSCLAGAELEFYARAANEYKVSFSAVIKTDFKSVEQVQAFTNYQKEDFVERVLRPTTKYLFGPLTYRSLGGEQKGFELDAQWSEAYLEDGVVIVPYNYSGQWLVNTRVDKMPQLELPLPLHVRSLRTPRWKNCTDSLPEHQDLESFWYYWDPSRSGCDHKVGVHYQLITPEFSKKTKPTKVSYPEYQNMLRDNKMSLTFGFGYVKDPADPQPFSDSDFGMGQMRNFVSLLRRELRHYNFQESEILENEYLGSSSESRKIGARFEFEKNNVQFEIKVVASGSIDQMELFAKSFSHDHDAFFGWFGHSRVGNGFDADQFSGMLRRNKNFYTLTPNYQMIYWAGCNSYSYYTKPFFDFKANLIKNDSAGTKSLDIISNGLPSYFSLNASNALILTQAMVNFERPTSYQEIINRIEAESNAEGIYVLANVLGDEDN